MERKLATILFCIILSSITISANTANSNTAKDNQEGFVYVVTEPGKAIVYVDGEYKGPTPGYYPAKVGSRKIKIEKRFWQTVEKDVEIKKAEIKHLTLQLRKGRGNITVLPTQSDAKVHILHTDGTLQKGIAPDTFQVPAGNYIVKVMKDDLSWQSDVEVETAETKKVYAVLKPL